MLKAAEVKGYTSRQVSDIAGVPMSTLHYWADTGLVTPSIRGSEGKRATRWWTLADLVAVRAIKALREAGCPLQTLRRAQDLIEASWGETVANTVLHWDGVDLLRVGGMGEVHSTVRHPGKGVLHLLAVPLGAWRAESRDEARTVDLDHLAELHRERRQRKKTPITPASERRRSRGRG